MTGGATQAQPLADSRWAEWQASSAVLRSLAEWGAVKSTSQGTLFFSSPKPHEALPDVAMKVISRAQLDGEAEWQAASEELSIHQSLNSHPQVLPLFSACSTADTIALVMPRAREGDLWAKVQYGTVLCEQEAKHFASQLFAGLRHLHRSRVAHCDVKPHNILLSVTCDRLVAQLCDFGLSQRLPAEPGAKIPFVGLRGSSGYIAPELYTKQDYDEQVDAFAAGVLLFRLLGGYAPYHPPDNFSEAVDFDPSCWGHVSEACQDLVQELLRVDPAQRLSASAALAHPWLKREVGGEQSAREEAVSPPGTSTSLRFHWYEAVPLAATRLCKEPAQQCRDTDGAYEDYRHELQRAAGLMLEQMNGHQLSGCVELSPTRLPVQRPTAPRTAQSPSAEGAARAGSEGGGQRPLHRASSSPNLAPRPALMASQIARLGGFRREFLYRQGSGLEHAAPDEDEQISEWCHPVPRCASPKLNLLDSIESSIDWFIQFFAAMEQPDTVAR